MSERISFVMPKRLKSLKELQELTGEDRSTILRRVVEWDWAMRGWISRSNGT